MTSIAQQLQQTHIPAMMKSLRQEMQGEVRGLREEVDRLRGEMEGLRDELGRHT